MNVNDQHFRSVGTFDTLHPVGQESRQHWTIGYLPYLRAWYPRYQRQIMDVHEKTLWSSIPHVFDTLSTIHTTQGQEIAIGRVVQTFLSWLLYKPPPPPDGLAWSRSWGLRRRTWRWSTCRSPPSGRLPSTSPCPSWAQGWDDEDKDTQWKTSCHRQQRKKS